MLPQDAYQTFLAVGVDVKKFLLPQILIHFSFPAVDHSLKLLVFIKKKKKKETLYFYSLFKRFIFFNS